MSWLVWVLAGAWVLLLLYGVALSVAAGRADRMWDEARARADEQKARDHIYGGRAR